LIEKLDGWLEIKQKSSSKRYDLVIKIREQLKEFVRLEPSNKITIS
jgi:hypothetical protein